MKCPHCTVTVHVHFSPRPLLFCLDAERKQVGWEASVANCPHCQQAIIYLESGNSARTMQSQENIVGPKSKYLSWPQSSSRPCPRDVPADLANDFSEAVRVLSISPQASAALTRRCLQQTLRDYGKTAKKDLFDQIQEVLDEGHISPSLADQLDAFRVIGNFAAHPLKSKTTGLILPVEPNEAEWNLDVLEDVFDHYFVKPAQVLARKAALNKKLSDGGKSPVK